ncbi:hypothetical protein Hanom_Chr11g00975191 [Helianthus anomalus]
MDSELMVIIIWTKGDPALQKSRLRKKGMDFMSPAIGPELWNPGFITFLEATHV